MSVTRHSRRRRSGRRLFTGAIAVLLAVGTVTISTVSSSLTARSEPVALAAPTSFAVSGAGFGHGRGMSQYGAYGAARQGRSWQQILSFYYPHTTRTEQPAGTTIKVWITADSDNDLRVMPAAGLRLSDTQGHSYLLPRGAGYSAWRVTRSGTAFALTSRASSGAWVVRRPALSATAWSFSDTAKIVSVWVPGGGHRELRGSVSLVKRGSGGRTVNRLPMEDYVKGVVQSEMPTSWAIDAVRAQAVAARSYAARLQAARGGRDGYDVCDTTNCQVYRGYAATNGSRRRLAETSRGNAAVKATSRTILTSGKAVVLTEFGSSNGGSTVKSGLSYQVAKLDPYDSVVRSHTWSKALSATSIARAWPAVGSVQRLQVTKRTGVGRWGGRVAFIRISGSKGTVTVTGTAFQSRFGLRSSLFTVGAASS